MEGAVLLGLILIFVIVFAFFPLGLIASALMLFAACVLLVGISGGATQLVGGCVLLVGAVLCAACSAIAREIRKLRRTLEVAATSPPVSQIRAADPPPTSQIRLADPPHQIAPVDSPQA